MRSNKEGLNHAVLAVEIQKKQSIYGFCGNQKSDFIKITVALPKLIAPAKRLLERGEVTVKGFAGHSYIPYETNIDFEIR